MAHQSAIWIPARITCFLLFIVSGCSTESHTTAFSTVSAIPEVEVIARVDTLARGQDEGFRRSHVVAHQRAVYQDRIHTLYWRDEVKTDLLMLLPVEGGFDIMKVDKKGLRYYRETTGVTDGRSFERKELLPR